MVSKFTYNKHFGLTRLSMNCCTSFFFCYHPSSRSISRESLYIKGTFFANKVLLSFDNNVVLWLGTDLLTLEYVFHYTNSRLILFKEGEDDMIEVRFEFSLKISADQFCEIRHISQTIYWKNMKFYNEILDTWIYILLNVQVKWSSETYYFKGLKLLDKSCQICQTRHLCTVWDIFGATGGILVRFKLGWKLDITSFPTIYGVPINSSGRKRTTCLKSWLKICQDCEKIKDSGYMKEFWHEEFIFIILFYLFIYLFINNYF
jgi:hypothetical protein